MSDKTSDNQNCLRKAALTIRNEGAMQSNGFDKKTSKKSSSDLMDCSPGLQNRTLTGSPWDAL
jgi:hypothetical protein